MIAVYDSGAVIKYYKCVREHCCKKQYTQNAHLFVCTYLK